MGTPGIDALDAKINALGLITGNIVYSSDLATKATASKPIYVDSASKLAAAALPFSVPITPATSTTTFLTATGTATADVMTTNVVKDGSSGATTFTKAGYLKVTITDTGSVLTNGDYYIQVGTLT